ncbi:MAG: hypothetical protein ACREVZ_12890, partial [Burkholderiales bacterium]
MRLPLAGDGAAHEHHERGFQEVRHELATAVGKAPALLEEPQQAGGEIEGPRFFFVFFGQIEDVEILAVAVVVKELVGVIEENALGIGLRQRLLLRAGAVGVSTATMYRYKANPEGMGLGTLIRLKDRLGLPLENGAAWSKSNVIAGERRRLSLEKTAAAAGGSRYTTVSPYTVNSELVPIMQLLVRADYGTRAPQIEGELLRIRAEREELYESCAYESWEIWNGCGYVDFFNGRGRFNGVPPALRQAQIEKFIDTSKVPGRHRFIYTHNYPELPMFGVYSPPGVALVRIDDIHLEYQA